MANYYSNGIRFMRDGIPCKMAPWVKELTDRSRKELLRGSFDNLGTSAKSREASAAERHPQTTYILEAMACAPENSRRDYAIAAE